jgi:carbonic anhydrase
VMGHAMCGGIRALLNGAPAEVSDFVGQWVRIAEPAKERAMTAPKEAREQVCEHEAVRLSLENLMTFPWIKAKVAAGNLALHGCYFDIRSGILERLGEDGTFSAISD